MQITFEQTKQFQYFHFSGAERDAVLVVSPTNSKDTVVQEGITVVAEAKGDIDTEIVRTGLLRVTIPGEFESAGIFVTSHSTHPESGILDLVEIEYEGVRCVYYSGEKNLEKDLLVDLGAVDVLLLRTSTGVQEQIKAINALDPQILVPFGEQVAQLESEMEMQFQSEKKLKAKHTDFQQEEYVLQVVKLD